MPIRVANDIPAKNQLTEEGIIFIEETRANTQDIRPLNILIFSFLKYDKISVEVLGIPYPISSTDRFLSVFLAEWIIKAFKSIGLKSEKSLKFLHIFW